MTDNGLAALAQCGFVCGIPKDAHQTEEHPWEPLHHVAVGCPDAATIATLTAERDEAQMEYGDACMTMDDQRATIEALRATLRAALDGLVEAAGWHLDNANRPNEGHVRLRAALATAYAATCSAESDQQVSATPAPLDVGAAGPTTTAGNRMAAWLGSMIWRIPGLNDVQRRAAQEVGNDFIAAIEREAATPAPLDMRVELATLRAALDVAERWHDTIAKRDGCDGCELSAALATKEAGG
jgi:hypothetical protein